MKGILTIGALLIAGLLVLGCGEAKKEVSSLAEQPAMQPPEGMVYIPGGSFMMGGKSEWAEPDEFPRRNIGVSAFYMDQTEVTNAQFAAFVDATGYVTTAEKALDWEELKKQLPPDTPRPADSILQPGSLVFQPTDGPVDLRDLSQWWEWTLGANWRHPEGPGTFYMLACKCTVYFVSFLINKILKSRSFI